MTSLLRIGSLLPVGSVFRFLQYGSYTNGKFSYSLVSHAPLKVLATSHCDMTYDKIMNSSFKM